MAVGVVNGEVVAVAMSSVAVGCKVEAEVGADPTWSK